MNSKIKSFCGTLAVVTIIASVNIIVNAQTRTYFARRATLSEGAGESGGGQNLSGYVGKYPSALFRGVPSLKTRLRRLLGSSYNAFFKRLQTEMPIENDGGSLVVRGCQAHSCGSDEAILVISSDNSLHVAIMSASRFRTWGCYTPALTRAMKQ